MREKSGKTPVLLSGKGFFPFEESLEYHVLEAIVIVSTGIGTSFFLNPRVGKLVRKLQPRHRSVHPKKVVKIIHCILEV